MNLQLQKFNQKNVELVPDTIDLMTDTELTQYYIQSWSLEQRNIGSLELTWTRPDGLMAVIH